VLAGIAVLAALGCEHLGLRPGRSTNARILIAVIAVAAGCLEYRSPQRRLLQVAADPPVYWFLKQLPKGVVLELPVPPRVGEDDFDPHYIFWSTRHWQKLLNGYSGYYPPSYQETLRRLQRFPDADSLTLLRERHVRYLVVHLAYLEPSQRAQLLEGLLAHQELQTLGKYNDWMGPTVVFEMKQSSP
jgi:hypothetical protein